MSTVGGRRYVRLMAPEPSTLELLRSRLADLEARQRAAGGASEPEFWERFAGRMPSPPSAPDASTAHRGKGRREAAGAAGRAGVTAGHRGARAVVRSCRRRAWSRSTSCLEAALRGGVARDGQRPGVDRGHRGERAAAHGDELRRQRPSAGDRGRGGRGVRPRPARERRAHRRGRAGRPPAAQPRGHAGQHRLRARVPGRRGSRWAVARRLAAQPRRLADGRAGQGLRHGRHGTGRRAMGPAAPARRDPAGDGRQRRADRRLPRAHRAGRRPATT